jgi:hypothetical protein
MLSRGALAASRSMTAPPLAESRPPALPALELTRSTRADVPPPVRVPPPETCRKSDCSVRLPLRSWKREPMRLAVAPPLRVRTRATLRLPGSK